MRHSTFALLAAGMFVLAGSSDLRAQDEAADADADAAAEATAEAAAEATADTPSDVQFVDATLLNPGAFEPMALNIEFSGSGDEWAAAITVPGLEMRIELLDLLLSEDKFSFSMVPPGGDEIECTLYQLSDDSFRGDCFDDGGTGVEMTIDAFEQKQSTED